MIVKRTPFTVPGIDGPIRIFDRQHALPNATSPSVELKGVLDELVAASLSPGRQPEQRLGP